MKDKDLKLDEMKVSHTLGGGEGVQGREVEREYGTLENIIFSSLLGSLVGLSVLSSMER